MHNHPLNESAEMVDRYILGIYDCIIVRVRISFLVSVYNIILNKIILVNNNNTTNFLITILLYPFLYFYIEKYCGLNLFRIKNKKLYYIYILGVRYLY